MTSVVNHVSVRPMKSGSSPSSRDSSDSSLLSMLRAFTFTKLISDSAACECVLVVYRLGSFLLLADDSGVH